MVHESLNGGLDQGGVARVVLIELIVSDDAFTSFTEPELVAELDLGTGFAALDDLDLVVVKTDDLGLIGDAAFADDAFVGLFDGGGKLI